MSEEEDSVVMTRTQKKKMEKQRNTLAYYFLEYGIKCAVLSHMIKDLTDTKMDTEQYFKKLKKNIDNIYIDVNIEYNDVKCMKDQKQFYVCCVELMNIYFKEIIKTIKDNKQEKQFNVLDYLKKEKKDMKKNKKKIQTELKEVEDKLMCSENDLNKITNKDKRDIRDFGMYVLGLKGDTLDKFVYDRIKDYEPVSTSETKKKYVSDDESDDESYEEESDDEDYNTEEEDEMMELLGDEWDPQDLEYLRLRKYHTNEKKKDIKYFRNLDEDEKDKTIDLIETIHKINDEHKPLLFKIIESNMSLDNKANVVKKLETIGENDENGNGENHKLKSWIEGLLSVPFGKYKKEKINKEKSTKKELRQYIHRCKKTLDKAVYGHEDAKNHILQIIAQNITNPNSKGNIFGIRGPPGNGKTSLVEHGIAKAIKRPFSFISLGGATDSSYLEGHSFTYEGSLWGEIVNVLIKSKCMNPVIYFDELDKVSETPKGEEIINILMHITDQSQNTHFNDKYFQGIDFDLSQCIFIFSYNDLYKINPILRDRIVNINTKGFKTNEKLNIATTYLLPTIMKDVGIEDTNIKIDEEVLQMIIEQYTFEGGVRKLKECLYEIVRNLNLRELKGETINNTKLKYPITVTKDMIQNDLFYKKYVFKTQKIHEKPRVGMVNGLYASNNDTGGITVVEALSIPTSEKLGLELTGQQGDIMRESMKVAKSVAWSILTEKIKEELQIKWKNGNEGIHLHCPEGATPKDGPSAGGAITTAIVSLLSGIPVKNYVAMTGEINLSGNITEIGGLDSKLMGAKKAGVKIALIPKDNEDDLHKIMKEYPDLVEKDKFEVIVVNNIYEILNIALIKEMDFVGCDTKPIHKKKKKNT